MLKLFAFDLDNTLLVEGSINGKNRESLRALQNAGKTIALVTGRVLRSPQFLAAQAGLRAYCIGSNGAVVATPDGKVLYKEAIDTPVAVQLIQIGIRHRIYFHFYSQETLFSPYCWPERYDHLIASKTDYGMRMQCNIHIQERADLEMGSQEMLKIQYFPGGGCGSAKCFTSRIAGIVVHFHHHVRKGTCGGDGRGRGQMERHTGDCARARPFLRRDLCHGGLC